jgi:hypothetical protein
MNGKHMTFANHDTLHLMPSGKARELRRYKKIESVERVTELYPTCPERAR